VIQVWQHALLLYDEIFLILLYKERNVNQFHNLLIMIFMGPGVPTV